MYFLVVLLDILGALIMTAILRSFGEVTVVLAIFFSLFPLGFAIFSEIIKLEALDTGTSERHKNITRVMGLMLILITLGLGAYPPYVELWQKNPETWTHPVLIWYAVIGLLLVFIPIFTEIRGRRKVSVNG